MVVTVRLEPRGYEIVVERGALAALGTRLAALGPGRQVALATSPSVDVRWGHAARASLGAAGFAVAPVLIPDGEAAKTLAVAGHAWEALVDAELDRSSTVVALGGGAVGDLAGFVAATYMRGIGVVQVPTTVLAQVDAAIGGKTAIDLPRGKNLVGAFHQPRLVLADPDTVLTLPERDFRSGLAEIVKHGAVLDADYFADVEASAAALLARDPATLERVIGGSCRIKAAVVERDEREAAFRAVLNYGHTIGHALEATTGFVRWTHGEAVALGIVAEARLAERLGLGSEAAADRQARLLAAVGLPTRIEGGVDADAVVRAIGRDKKKRGGRVPFVLAPEVGKFALIDGVEPGDVRAVLDGLGA